MLRRVGHLFEYLFRRHRLEDDLDEELRSSFEMTVEQFIARGMAPAEARRAARLEFEGLEQVKESVRDTLVGSAFHAFLQDVRYAWRGLRKRPSFTLVALITLALGIGVNTAVFSVFYAVLMRPLPYDHPEQLVRIWAGFPSRGNARAPLSGGLLREIEQRNRSFTGVAGIWMVAPRTFVGGDPEQVKNARVTVNFFDLLGVRAALGRTFRTEDNGGPAVMLADGFFRRRFGADHSLIGKTLPVRGLDNTLVGVLPADFQLHFAPDANLPGDVQTFETFGFGFYERLTQHYLRLIARLKPDVSIQDAQRDMDRVAAEIRGKYPVFGTDRLTLGLAGLQDDAFGDVHPALVALFAGAAFVLLICCVNVTSLLLARASDRRKEIALRLAIGASRGRILRQLLVEAGVLSFLGGVAGLAVAGVVFRGLLAIRPERLARIEGAGLSWQVLAFAAVASLAAALLFGLAPAFQSFRLDHIDALRSSGRSWLGRFQRRAGGVLVAAEIMLAFVLVTGAALTARTLSKIEAVRPGFEPSHLLTFQLELGGVIEPTELPRLEAQLAAVPGVESVGAAIYLPLDTDVPNWYGPYWPDGIPRTKASTVTADFRPVTPGYFEAMQTRLIEGRYFDGQDREDGQQVVIVDDLLARSTWPDESAIGKKLDAEHVTRRGFEYVVGTVVGVIEHVHNHSLTKQVRPQIYMPFSQSPRSPLTFVVRTNVPPLSLVPAVREVLHRLNPTIAMDKARPMDEYVAREIAPASFTAVLATIFGVLALVLAATGIYGVLNYQVSRRLPEMGIRMALGASAGDVLRLVLREGLSIAIAGVALGAVAALLAASWLSGLMYNISPSDPLSYALALVLLPSASLLGCWRPAWRAAGANPAEIIREE